MGNLTYSVSENQLRDVFAPHGEVVSVKVLDRKGFGFVEMATPDQAQAAMDALNGSVLEGRTMKIDEAKPMQPRRDFGSGGGYGGGNDGGFRSPYGSGPRGGGRNGGGGRSGGGGYGDSY